MPEIWTTEERRAWRWPEDVSPSRWAEENRILPSHVTEEPGPWRNERAPYLVGIMDAIHEPGVAEVVVCKGAQIGYSEAIRNVLGFWIDRHPGPTLIVMPDQKGAEALMEERIKPLIEFTPAIARYLTDRAWDVKKSRITFANGMSVYFAWAGSSAGLKSRPIRHVLLEEPDDYVKFSGEGGDPISKAQKRLTVAASKGRSRLLIGGTPTVRTGNIWRYWESCGDQRHYWVPCPHCRKYQQLRWAQVKFAKRIEGEDRAHHAERARAPGGAWYQCEHCNAKIEQGNKRAMLVAGRWAGSDQAVTEDGRIVGTVAKSRRVGFHISSIYSPWVTFGQLAAEWIEAQDDPQKLCDFVNQNLAEPFEEKRGSVRLEVMQAKVKDGPPPLPVPPWAKVILATADAQGLDEETGYFWYTVRAWGLGYRSQLLDYGLARSRKELASKTLDRQFGTSTVYRLLIDSGGPWGVKIHQWALEDRRIIPTKGDAERRREWLCAERENKRHGTMFVLIDTFQAKNLLQSLINDEKQLWLANNTCGEEYARQMTAESRIYNAAKRREEWIEVVRHSNHLWDCEAIQIAGAWLLRMGEPELQEAVGAAKATDTEEIATFGGRRRW